MTSNVETDALTNPLPNNSKKHFSAISLALLFFVTTISASIGLYEYYATSSKLNHKNSQLKDKFHRLVNDRRNLNDEVKGLSQNVNDKSQQVTSLSQQVKDLSQQVNDFSQEKLNNQAIISKLTADMDAKKNNPEPVQKLDIVESALSKSSSDILKITQENQELKKTIEKYKQMQLKTEKALLDKLAKIKAQNEKDAKVFDKLLSDSNLNITNIKNRFTIVEFGQDIMYANASSDLTKAGQASLKKLAEILKQYPSRKIAVQGHSDSQAIGAKLKDKFFSNWELSSARAAAAIRYLQYAEKIDPKRLILVAYSSYQPIVVSEKSDEYARNRRIEIILLPEDFEFFVQEIKE